MSAIGVQQFTPFTFNHDLKCQFCSPEGSDTVCLFSLSKRDAILHHFYEVVSKELGFLCYLSSYNIIFVCCHSSDCMCFFSLSSIFFFAA